MRRSIWLTGLAALGAALTMAAPGAHAESQTLKVGTMSGPDAQIWAEVTKVAARDGLAVKVIEFNDYVQPNAALDAGDLDANGFQHQPFLDSQIKQRGYKIANVGLTYTSPMGFYSKRSGRSRICRWVRRSASRTIRRTATGRCCCCRNTA